MYWLYFIGVIMLYTINTLDQLKPILKGFRKSQGLSQKDVASKLAISQQAYQVLESSPQNVTLDRLFKVFAVLGVKIQLSDGNSINQSTKGRIIRVRKGNLSSGSAIVKDEGMVKRRINLKQRTAAKKEQW